MPGHLGLDQLEVALGGLRHDVGKALEPAGAPLDVGEQERDATVGQSNHGFLALTLPG